MQGVDAGNYEKPSWRLGLDGERDCVRAEDSMTACQFPSSSSRDPVQSRTSQIFESIFNRAGLGIQLHQRALACLAGTRPWVQSLIVGYALLLTHLH